MEHNIFHEAMSNVNWLQNRLPAEIVEVKLQSCPEWKTLQWIYRLYQHSVRAVTILFTPQNRWIIQFSIPM